VGEKAVSNYTRGRAREYRIKKKLLMEGALWVVRSYGSHGLFDLTAVFPDCVRLIQVKKKYIHPRERRALADFAKKVKAGNISVEVWFTQPFRILRLGGG
jgi:Holliday junction resolvase